MCDRTPGLNEPRGPLMKRGKASMKTYTIGQIIEDVACELRNIRTDTVMIRTAINDRIDAVEKDGFKVREFNQDKAVKRTSRLIRAKRQCPAY